MSILIKPIITEKATAQSEDLNVYAFEVGVSVRIGVIRILIAQLA